MLMFVCAFMGSCRVCIYSFVSNGCLVGVVWCFCDVFYGVVKVFSGVGVV